MKKIFLLSALVWSVVSYGQPTTVSGYNTFNERRNQLAIIARALHIPSGGTAALTTGQWVGAGAVYYDSTGGNKGMYVFTGTAWVRVVDTTWTSLVSSANNGNSIVSGAIGIGGSDLSRYSAIGLNGFPLTLNHNAVNNAAQSDSNSLRLTNNTAAATTTDSLVSPAVIFSVFGRKSLPVAASQLVRFRNDVFGSNAPSNGAAIWRISTSINNGAYTNLVLLKSDGAFQPYNSQNQVLNIYGHPIGGTLTGNNVFFGASSGILTTPGGVSLGYQNTGIGDFTLSTNTIGRYNTAVGYGALQNADSAFNTAMGYGSLNACTTCTQNAAFGATSLLNTTSGQKNAAFGPGSGENNTTGSFNTPLGHDAMLQNTSGSENVGVGWLSESQNRTGSNNVGVGTSSMRNIVLANTSVFIGSESGYLDLAGAATQEDTVTNAIAIGYRSYTTASNQMRLGNPNLSSTFIYGARVGGSSDSVYVKKSDGSLGTVAQSSISGGGGSTALSAITAASGNNSINNADNLQVWNWNTLTAGAGMQFTSPTTTGSNGHSLVSINLSGTNGASSVGSSALVVNNTHAGTTSSNTAINATASGGTTSNIAISATGATAALQATGPIIPSSTDAAALGTTTNQFADLFLAEGGVINWDNGDATLTQAGNTVTLAGADLAISNLTSGRIPIVSTSGLLTDNAGLQWDNTDKYIKLVNSSSNFVVQSLPVASRDLSAFFINGYYDASVAFHQIDVSRSTWGFIMDNNPDAFRALYAAAGPGSATTPWQITAAGDVENTGNIVMGGTTLAASATKTFHLYNGTVPSASITDGVLLYAQDVTASSELKVRDEAGNITVLSPHDFSHLPGKSEKLSWSFNSERNGEFIAADMTLALRTIEKQSAEIEELKKQVAELKGLIYKKKDPVKIIYTGKTKTH